MRPAPSRSVGALVPFAALALAALLAAPASALPLELRLDPAQSRLRAEGGASAPLEGRIGLELGGSPPLASATSLDVVSLAVSGGGLELALDPSVPGPGLGLLEPGGAFTIPTLFLRVRQGGAESPLTLLDVTGTLAPEGACGPPGLCLETAVSVDTLGAEGVLTAEVVAAVPEPASGALLALGAGLLAALRRGAAGAVR